MMGQAELMIYDWIVKLFICVCHGCVEWEISLKTGSEHRFSLSEIKFPVKLHVLFGKTKEFDKKQTRKRGFTGTSSKFEVPIFKKISTRNVKFVRKYDGF